MQTRIVTPELLDEIEAAPRETQAEWLFLEPSDEFRGCWEVWSLWPEWFFDFESIVGNYRLITLARLEEFLARAEELEYKPVFTRDPVEILESYQGWKDPPPVSLNSTLERTVQGFLSWQVTGFNKLIKPDLPAGIAVWCTGAGKTAFMASALLWHSGDYVAQRYDLALVVVKSNNKIDTQRKLLRLAGINSIVIDGPYWVKRKDGQVPGPRQLAYAEIEALLQEGQQVVAITNYEKLREDTAVFRGLVRRRHCLFFWDEMPTRLSNPDTQLYKAAKSVLYESFYSKPRPRWMRHWQLSATPIENSPLDTWGQVNLMCPGLLGTEREFKNIYAAALNPMRPKQVVAWHNLDRLEASIGFMVHRVSKDDPEVRAMFPEVLPMPTTIDWSPKHRAVYDKLTGRAVDLLEELEDANVLALIQVMQMVCDAPSMVKTSADNRETFSALLEQYGDGEDIDLPFSGPRGSEIAQILLKGIHPSSLTDAGHTKLDKLREIAIEKHPDSKILVFSTWAHYIFPVWEHWCQEWGLNYVVYTGTSSARQKALDAFRDDPDIQLFLSGDSGSDSIDIAEANVVVNYNIPWKWTTLTQRVGRSDRVTNTSEFVYRYDLVMPDSIDERKLAITERKRGYHQAIYDGLAREEMVSANMTGEDLRYILSGEDFSDIP